MMRSISIYSICCILFPSLLLANEATTKVTVAQPLERDSNQYDFFAHIEAAPRVNVRAQLEGKIDKVLCKVGQDVKRGDVLFMLAADDLTKRHQRLAGEIAAARGALDKAEKALQQASQDPQNALDVPRLKAKRDLAAVSLQVLEKELAQLDKDATKTAVTAPTDGHIVKLAVAPGERVSAGASFATLLCAIAQINPMYVTFEVDERTFLYLRKIARDDGEKQDEAGRCPVKLKLGHEDDFAHEGFGQCSDSRLDPKSGKIRFLAEFTNDKNQFTQFVLAPDTAKQEAMLRLAIGKARKALLVPGAAIGFNAHDDPQVLVVDSKNIAQPRVVELGPTTNGFQAITGGLKADEWVIVGAERPALDSPDQVLSPNDFATDIRALRVRPGTTVDPQRVKLNLPHSALRRTPEPTPK